MITSFITIFLYPGWVNGSLFGLQDYFKDIWILISNVVYFIFAGVLIVLAFMNIVWKWEGNWELKQALPKFIVGVLIVPFSWFFVQFILSITSILTVWVLTLPYDTFKDRPELSTALDPSIASQQMCTDLIIDLKWDWGKWVALSDVVKNTDSESSIGFPDSLRCDTSWEFWWVATIKEILEGTRWGEWLKNSVFWITNIYTYWILRIQNLNEINEKDIAWWIKEIADLLFKIIFDLLFVVIYLLLMVALFLALFVRVVRLWIYMMLSPAFWLLYFFGKSSEGVWSDNAKFSIKEFVSLALVPVYVSAALAFWLVFILVAWSGIEKWQEESKNTLEAWGFSITIIWAFAETSEKSVIWKLIVKIFWLVILWLAVMAALRSSETTRAVVEPIAAFWKSVWELAAKAPTYAPIIPTGWPWSKSMSVTWLASAGSRIEQSFRWEAQSRWSDFADRILPNQWWPTAWLQDIFTRSWVREDSVVAEKFKIVDRAMKEYGSDILKDQRVRQKFEDELTKIWIKAEITSIKDPTLLSKTLFDAMDKEAWMINHDVTTAKTFQETYFNQNVVDKSKWREPESSSKREDTSSKPQKVDTSLRVTIEWKEDYYKEFISNWTKVPENVLISIASKISEWESLNSYEIGIRQGDKNKERIEELLNLIKDQTKE